MIRKIEGPRDFRPAYRALSFGDLRARVERAVGALADCRACPRDCGVDRLAGKWSACKTGRHAVVSSHFPHFGEEDCLRGWNGSGTIFFSHCNLRCRFCQNFDISQGVKPTAEEGAPAGEIASMMLSLQRRGCHNVNFVTPEHVVPQVLEAVEIAIEGGLEVPIVYNTSAYDALESIAWMDGIVDIYMPDFKVWSPARAKGWLMAEDYPEVARAAIRAMHEQVGPLEIGPDGLARRGVLIRHLVMPGALDDTRAILEWIAAELGRDAYVNLMDQYRPAGKVKPGDPELGRRTNREEFERALEIGRELGLRLDRRRPHPLLRRARLRT
ncbi:MAG: radical SAM protein [Gemmatimonadota bacterium]|nr:radical SAM protein [Gemmatimonadota bacterium]